MTRTSAIFASDRVRAFVADFYAADAELHAKAKEWIARPAPRRAG